jgi:beta-phosphoglucomutase-like phosphatase (HAD superfamily)
MMAVRRITRDHRLSQEEAAENREVRQRIEKELPDLIARHHERLATFEQLEGLLEQLKAAPQSHD